MPVEAAEARRRAWRDPGGRRRGASMRRIGTRSRRTPHVSFSTTRRRAERARGLRSACSADGVRGARTRRTVATAPHTHGTPGRARAIARRRRREALLDEAVLTRVIRQHGDATGRHGGVDRPVERRGSCASSLLTSMRIAWKVRLAGWPPRRRVAAGIAAVTIAASSAVVEIGRAATIRLAMRPAKRSSP